MQSQTPQSPRSKRATRGSPGLEAAIKPGTVARMLADLSDAEVLHEALVRPRDAHVAYPGIREIHRPGWSQRITPAFARGGFNSVDLAVLADADADAVIDATIAEYDALGIRFRWTVGPDSRPHDLGERLLRRGLRRHEVAVMAAPLAAITIRGTQPLAGLTVERVDLDPVVRGIAEVLGLTVLRIDDAESNDMVYSSDWMLLARDPAALAAPELQLAAEPEPERTPENDPWPLWTDAYSNLLQVFKG